MAISVRAGLTTNLPAPSSDQTIAPVVALKAMIWFGEVAMTLEPSALQPSSWLLPRLDPKSVELISFFDAMSQTEALNEAASLEETAKRLPSGDQLMLDQSFERAVAVVNPCHFVLRNNKL